MIAVTQELDEFPFQLDMNSGEHLGVGTCSYHRQTFSISDDPAGWTQALIDRGVRSSAKAYLADNYLARPNLDVLLNAHVARVLQTNESDALTLRTVEFQVNGTTTNLTASQEVVLSAGSIGTPVILMHSGIGNASVLGPLGIPVLLDNPSVRSSLPHLLMWTHCSHFRLVPTSRTTLV